MTWCTNPEKIKTDVRRNSRQLLQSFFLLTIIKSSETQHEDNCFPFRFFQSYNFKTPRMNQLTMFWNLPQILINFNPPQAWWIRIKNLKSCSSFLLRLANISAYCTLFENFLIHSKYFWGLCCVYMDNSIEGVCLISKCWSTCVGPNDHSW